MLQTAGRVALVGAGPGDPELLTCKALRLIGEADAIVFDRLVAPEIMALCPAPARRFYVGKAPRQHAASQDEINHLLLRLARSGLKVVRLKGGDPFIFGRGAEEAQLLTEHGVPVEIVPGITSAQGAAASIGVPLTHRGLATSLRYVTGHRQADGPLDLPFDSMVDEDSTLVVYMGAATIAQIADELMSRGRAPGTPALAIADATTPRERVIVAQLDGLAQASHALDGPVLFIIGAVVGLLRAEPVAETAPREVVCPCRAALEAAE